MDAGPARRRATGFSLAELLLTLVALGLVVWLALRIVDRGTRIPGDTPATSGPEAVLDAAIRNIVEGRAGRGGGWPARRRSHPARRRQHPAARAFVLPRPRAGA